MPNKPISYTKLNFNFQFECKSNSVVSSTVGVHGNEAASRFWFSQNCFNEFCIPLKDVLGNFEL